MKKLIIIVILVPILSQASTIVNLKKKLEKKIKCSLIVSSGDRSHDHNRRIGGAKNSWHLKKGKALDLVRDKSCKLTYKEIAIAAKEYFNGVIYYERHVHVDLRKNKVFFKGSYK